MEYNPVNEYKIYANRFGYRKDLYKMISTKFNIKSAIYPGSHIDITPSIYISKVVYIDNFKGAIKFFKYIDEIKGLINKQKEYTNDCDITFLGQDYTKPMDISSCDLIISQYAGFVGQATKQYLKSSGYLLCNDSHGDATLARFDDDFKLIGVIDASNKFTYTKLKEYFLLPKGKSVDLNYVREKMKGPKYTLTAENYLFQKI